MLRYILSLIILLGAAQSGVAEELHLILNGKALHLGGGNYNESNWGLGFEYDFEARGNWIPFANGSFFKDSNKQTSTYLGGGLKRRFLLEDNADGWHIDAGVIGFLMTRKDYKNNDPFPGALPFVSIGKSWYALNVTYIPKVSPKHKEIIFLQLMFRLAEF